MIMMKSLQVCTFIVVASLFVLSTLGCRTREQENTIRENGQNKIMDSQSILLYKTSFSTGSASGGCGSTTTTYWYGTHRGQTDFLKSYKTLLNDQGWNENEDSVNAWHKDDGDIHFRGYLEIYDDLSEIDTYQSYYPLPDTFIQEAQPYELVYQFSLFIIPPCYERYQK